MVAHFLRLASSARATVTQRRLSSLWIAVSGFCEILRAQGFSASVPQTPDFFPLFTPQIFKAEGFTIDFKTAKRDPSLNAFWSSFARGSLVSTPNGRLAKLLQNAFNRVSLAVLKSIVKPSALKILGVKRGKKSGVWSKSSEKPRACKILQYSEQTIQREGFRQNFSAVPKFCGTWATCKISAQ